MDLRDIALTVREVVPGQFGWVLLEGTGEAGLFTSYARLHVSPREYDSYSTALAAGIGALRGLGTADQGPRRTIGCPNF